MATALAPSNTAATSVATVALKDRVIEYVPFGGTEQIKLTIGMVRDFIAIPTKQGKLPSDAKLMEFCMVCKARELDPWVGDCYLVGYDSQDGPKFSVITAIQALLKRAEANPNFDGMESGVTVLRGDDEVIRRPGNLVFPGEKLVGGWARLWRKDRAHAFYDEVPLTVYDTKRSQWAKDPGGMIDKVAQASVLRAAFPSQLGKLYIEQERGAIERGDVDHVAPQGEQVTTLASLTKRLQAASKPAAQKPETPVESATTAEREPGDDDPGVSEEEEFALSAAADAAANGDK